MSALHLQRVCRLHVLRNISGKTSIKILGTDKRLQGCWGKWWLILAEKQEGKAFNGSAHTKLYSEMRLSRGLTCRHWNFSQHLLIYSLQRWRAKIVFGDFWCWVFQCMSVCMVLWRETWHISNFRVRGPASWWKYLEGRVKRLEALKERGERQRWANAEMDLSTPLASAEAKESWIYCLDHGINLREEQGFCCVYPRERGLVLPA